MNISIGVGYSPMIYKYRMSAQERQFPERIYNKLVKIQSKPKWVLLDDKRIMIENDDQLKLACNLAAIFHNDICLHDPCNDMESEHHVRSASKYRRHITMSSCESQSSSEQKDVNIADPIVSLTASQNLLCPILELEENPAARSDKPNEDLVVACDIIA
jgi:hypothetical protein